MTAVLWANVDTVSYDAIARPLHFWVNDIGMVFFFALAAKEVFEATLPGGPLSSPRRALSPLAAAVGGMVVPALIYLALASTRGPADLVRGWAIPCATDIAFSAMVARLLFRTGHPAIPFLLLLAIADDALGLVILAVFYPSGPLSAWALVGLMAAAVLLAVWLRRRGTRTFWPYILGPGALSWAALYFGGFHPALALVPIVPFMPHAPADLGLFDLRELRRPDVRVASNTGGPRPSSSCCCCSGSRMRACHSSRSGRHYYVLAGLLLGKPVGIVLFANAARLSARTCRPAFAPAICWWWASRRQSVSRSRSFSRRLLFPPVRCWPRRRWGRCSASPARHSRSSWLASPVFAPSLNERARYPFADGFGLCARFDWRRLLHRLLDRQEPGFER